MTTTNKAPERLLDLIRKEHRFLLSSHLSPDGDAIGSELGLARILRKLGKGATIWNRDSTPGIYARMPGSDRIHVGEEPPGGYPEAFDAVILLECPGPERTGLEDRLEGDLPLVNIDHHLGNSQYGNINWVDTAAPSLGEMIARLARALKVTLDEETATCLFLTLVTDTGGFRFSNATPEAFDAAAALVRDGAQPELVSRWVNESKPESALRLLGRMLETLELHHDGRIASAMLTREMYESTGARPGDTEGLVDYPRSIAGVEAVALLREIEDGRYKVSLRSRGETDVEQIARASEGGGHKNAAGFETDGDAAGVRDRIVSRLAEIVG